jgi:thioredoxin-related protein
MLKKNTFTDKTVAEFFNTNFINVSINGEKGVGPTLVRQYQIQGYPTLIIADDTGKPLLYTVGYIDSKTILDFAKAALAKK